MITNSTAAIASYIPRDRVAAIVRPDASIPIDGVALLADISGFTALTEALAERLSADRGAEELTNTLDHVFTPLVAAIEEYHGSVLKFSGDALIIWFGREPRIRRTTIIARATAAALAMQAIMAAYGQIETSIGLVTLRMKIGLAYGPIRRFVLGLPEYGLEDAPGGHTLDRMAEAEHHATPGEIVTDNETLAYAGDTLILGERRESFVVIHALRRIPPKHPWPPIDWTAEPITLLISQLSPYVPAQIVRAITATGQTQVAELKPVVSMFVQFHGIDYDHDPHVAARLQTYFGMAQAIASRYGGRVNRLITGDKGSLLHVIFGAPTAVEEQEDRALRCALDLQRECGTLPGIRAQRIGVARGRVFAGPVGGPGRHDYTTMGDTINLSARLMQAAADGEILFDSGVREHIGDTIEIEDRGAIQVKGKADPVHIFSVRGTREQRRIVAPGLAIFGRDRERASLQNRLHALGQHHGGVVLLSGALGMGKTLLLDALHAEDLSAEDRPQWLSSACLSYGQQLSGYAIIDLIRDLLSLTPGASPDETRTQLTALCAELFGVERVSATFPYLVRFMGLPAGEEGRRLEGLAGESLRWRIFEVVRELFQRAASRAPLVVAIDDLHWSDPTSLALVEQLIPIATGGAPLLLILALRPERDTPAWALREEVLRDWPEHTTQIELEALSPETAAGLAQEIVAGLPGAFAARLAAQSGGNPLFLVELLRALGSRGLLENPEQLSEATVEALGLPENIQGLLIAQIDRLVAEARHVLQIASVIGPTFLTSVLAAIATEERALDRRISELSHEEFIRPEDQQGSAYRFRHTLVQQSTYSTLLYERRRAYHREVAEALERLFPGQVLEQSGLLAYHYERAEDIEQALRYHLQAADSARLLGANQEAEGLYRRALELFDRSSGATDPERRARIYLKLAQVRSNELDFTGAQELYDQAFALLDQVERTRPAESEGEERVIRLGVFEHGPSTLDPGLLEISDINEIVRDLFEGLVEVDTELNILPAVARRWQISEDGYHYRFELREGLQWSDGAPLSAYDFVFAWRRNLNPKQAAPQAHQLYVLAGAEAYHRSEQPDPANIGVQAFDELTLEIQLAVPTTFLLYILAAPIAFPQPAHIIDIHGQHWSEPANLVSNGAFQIAEWEQGNRIILHRSKTYHGIVLGNLHRAECTFVEPSLEHFLNGEIDICIVEDQDNMRPNAKTQVFLNQHLATYFLCYDCRKTPFSEKLIRKAFSHCINRAVLVQEVWSNVQRAADGGIVPPGVGAHSPEIAPIYNPAYARQLLQTSEFAKLISEQPLTLAASVGFGKTPEYLQRVWQEQLGIDVRVITDIPIEQILIHLADGTIQMALIGWDLEYPDPGNILHALFHSDRSMNYFGWGNTRFDQLVEKAMQTAVWEDQLALYREADLLLVAEDTAVVPLYYQQSHSILRNGYHVANTGSILRTVGIPLKYIYSTAETTLAELNPS